ncbi:MAG: TlpA family protein disulfide reductase [Flavobacteriales bacterium]|nr:TlpA family protein disulfide reductase [Flavobacteriales bacterium]
MKWLTEWWEKYKTKSVWSKLTDAFYLVFFIMVITPSGRTWLQRGLLQVGLFSSTEINEDTMLSDASLQWPLTDLEGNTTTLSELEGKVVFLNFWSTWCGPCTAEMPNIIALMQRVDDVVFIFAAHEPRETVQNYMTKKDWKIPAYTYRSAPGPDLHHGSLPTTFIIDANGRIVHRSSGMKKWNTQETVDLLNSLTK